MKNFIVACVSLENGIFLYTQGKKTFYLSFLFTLNLEQLRLLARQRILQSLFLYCISNNNFDGKFHVIFYENGHWAVAKIEVDLKDYLNKIQSHKIYFIISSCCTSQFHSYVFEVVKVFFLVRARAFNIWKVCCKNMYFGTKKLFSK